MKSYIVILFILGLGALTSYWGITSDKMARSFVESHVPSKQQEEADACEKQPDPLEKSYKVNEYQIIELEDFSSATLTFSGQDEAH